MLQPSELLDFIFFADNRLKNNSTISNTNRTMHKLRARNKKNAIKATYRANSTSL